MLRTLHYVPIQLSVTALKGRVRCFWEPLNAVGTARRPQPHGLRIDMVLDIKGALGSSPRLAVIPSNLSPPARPVKHAIPG